MIKLSKQDTAFIRWQLVHACNFACPGCGAPSVEINCVLAKGRLLRMAQKLLALPAARFEIALVGGEATLHPLLPDLTRWLLRSRRPVELTIESNGSQEIEYYLAFAANARPGALRFLLNAHPACANLQQFLTLIGALVERGLPVSVKLFAGEASPHIASAWLQALRNLAKVAPFQILQDGGIEQSEEEIVLLGGETARTDNADGEERIDKKGHHSVTVAGQYSDNATEEAAPLSEANQHPAPFCGIGAHILRIEPDGRFFGAFCAQAPARPPLWQEGVWPDDALGIVYCQEASCQYASLHPHFADFALAQAWHQSQTQLAVSVMAAGKKSPVADAHEKEKTVWSPRLTRLPVSRETECSVVIFADDPEADLARCLDSVLIQDIAALQIIVLDRTDGKSGVIQEYVERYPEFMRVCRPASGRSSGEALNLGLSLATGRYIAFLNGADMLAHDFLASGISAMAKADAQIAVFTLCQLGKQDVQYTITPGIYVAHDALRQYFSQNRASICGMLFRTDFLFDYNAAFLPTDLAPALGLLLPALAFGTVCVKGETGYFRAVRSCGSGEWPGLNKTLNFVERFCAEFGMDAQLPALIADWLYAGFLVGRRPPLAHASPVHVESSKHIFQKLIGDLAQNAPERYFSPVNADFGEFKLYPPPPIFAGSCGMEVALSLSIVVVANHPNSNLAVCLKWLEQAVQTIPDIEVLVFTSASPSLLPISPACFPITHIPPYCPEGYLRNCALDAAKGQFVIFIDPRRYPDADSLAEVAMAKTTADIIFCGYDVVKDGFAEYNGPAAGPLSAAEALTWLLANDLGHYGKVYNLSFLRAQHLRFAGNLNGPDAAFAARVILAARAVAALHISTCFIPENEPVSMTAIMAARANVALWQALADYPPAYLEIVRDKLNAQLQEWLLPACREPGAATITVQGCMENKLLREALLRLARCQNSPASHLSGKKQPWRPAVEAVPLVSVIVSVYNQENWVGRCLDSILAQSLRALEIIVVNDASTDGTLNICLDYAHRDTRIHILDMKRNRGQGHCRNVAIAASRGRFITFVDSDDYILPGFLLSAAVQLLRNPEIDYIQFGKTLPDGTSYSLYSSRREITGRQMVELYLAEKMEYWECWGKVYRREFLARGELRFARHFFEDEIFLLEAYAAAKKLIIDPHPAYVYERKTHAESTMAPVQWTHRHLAGFLARCAEVDAFMLRHPELDEDGAHAYRKLVKVYEYFRPLVLGYLAAKAGKAIAVLDAQDFGHLASSPSFIRIFLEDYAKMHAEAYDTAAKTIAASNSSPWHFASLRGVEAEAAPAVTFLVLARDCAGNLTECLASLVGQDNVEVLVVDAESQDETPSICLEMAEKYANLGYFSAGRFIPDGCLYQMLLTFAAGEYVLCLSGDELLAPAAVGRWLGHLNGARPNVLHLGELSLFDALPPAPAEPGEETMLAMLDQPESLRLSGWLLKRDFLLSLGRPFPPAFACANGFLPRVLLATSQVICLETAPRPQQQKMQTAFQPQSRAKMMSFLANVEYALSAIAQMEQSDNVEFLAQKWLDAVCGGKGEMHGWLLEHIQANLVNVDGGNGEWLPEFAELCARLADTPQLLRWLFLDYVRLWALSEAAA